MTRFRLLLICAFLLWSFSPSEATDIDQLTEAFDVMYHPSLDSTAVYDVANLVLEHEDCVVFLDSGTVYFCRPLEVESAQQYWGGLFVGSGRFRFDPPVPMEKQQLQRFYGAEALDREIGSAQLILGAEFTARILQEGVPGSASVAPETARLFDEQHQYLVADGSRESIFDALKALIFPAGRDFLLINTVADGFVRAVYAFDPYAREEITLRRTQFERGMGERTRLVCSYSSYCDETYVSINGLSKDQLVPHHYDIEIDLQDGGEVSCRADLETEISGPTQMIRMYIRPGLTVDSVSSAGGARIEVMRGEGAAKAAGEFYLYFDSLFQAGERQTLTFYYSGRLKDSYVGEEFVSAGSDWFPRYSRSQRTTFDLTFRVNRGQVLLAAANKIDQSGSGGRWISRWRVPSPVSNVTFSVGRYEKYELPGEGQPPVEFWYDRGLHVRAKFDQDEEQRIAASMMGSQELFAHYFGRGPQSKLTVAEILHAEGEAFPGYVRFGVMDFTESAGGEMGPMYSARETARQWWGVGVDYATYHDSWLCEGMAEYSALMGLQATDGNDRFMRVLEGYRDQIYDSRRHRTAGAGESGTIGLGYRATGGSKEAQLIIQRKAAYIFHMLRNLLLDLSTMEEDQFLAMMRDWYHLSKGRQVTTQEFKRHVERYTGIDMSWFFRQYLYSDDLPAYRFSYQIQQQDDGRNLAVCQLEREGVPEDWVDYVPIEISFSGGGQAYLRLLADRRVTVLELPPIEGSVAAIKCNPFHSVLAKVEQ